MAKSSSGRIVLTVLLCLVAVDLLIVSADLLREGGVALLTLGTAVATVGLCALIWFGFAWARWLLLGFLALRAIPIARAVASSFGQGEVLRPGAMLVLLVYVGAAAVLVSPLMRRDERGAA